MLSYVIVCCCCMLLLSIVIVIGSWLLKKSKHETFKLYITVFIKYQFCFSFSFRPTVLWDSVEKSKAQTKNKKHRPTNKNQQTKQNQNKQNNKAKQSKNIFC